MPWVADYLRDGAYIRFTGITTGADLIDSRKAFHSRATAPTTRFALLDFTDVESLDVRRTDIDWIVDDDLIIARTLPDLSVAIIAPQPDVFGVARMWEIQVWESGWRTKLARSWTEALDWLAEHGIETQRLAEYQRSAHM